MGAISYLFVIYNRRDGSILHRSLRVFLMNRAADIFYLIALFASLTLASEAGISDYTFTELNGAAARLSSQTIFGMNGVEFIVLMFFLGSAAKSAQFPLHVWLSDAMTAPTPISALIHAATMVTAGVYLLLRIPELILAAPAISEAMIVIGIVTASLAGLQALFQYQIKRVLAYSTVSQLGYMIAAVGAGAFSASFAHLITHAFAKSLLFLAAGGVMMRLHHEQDMRRMGGLHSSMKFEALLFFAGTLSISGVFPLAGFFSKTDVVRSVGASIQSGAPSLYLLFASVSLLTPLYLFRAYFMIFTGARRDHHLMPEEHAVVGSARLAMAFALLLSLTSGFIYCISNSQTLIAELIPLGGTTLREGGIHPATIASSIAFGLAGMALAYTLPSVRARMNRFRSFEYTDRFIRTLIDRNYFLDDIYLLLSKGFVLSARAAHRADSAIDRVVHAASGMFKRITLIADSLERVIDRIIHFPVSVIFRAAGIFQTVQTGYIHHYLYYAISAAVLMAVAFIYTL
jgi:NADH-quinone oxidoreductase subunit L